MSVGSNLQEMENVVTKGAAPAEPMQSLDTATPGQTGSWEDLGGPTPENYRPDDESAKLDTASKTLSQVKDVVNAKAKPAMPMQGVKEEIEDEEDSESYDDEEEIVSEEMDEEEDDEEEGDEEEDDKKKKMMKKMKEEIDIEEDVNALLEGEELSEEFQEKARTIFEAAISSKVSEIAEEMETAYEDALIEEVQAIKESLTERLDAYLEYVADEWIQENALVIGHGLQTEMTESFLSGMKQLFEEHYVTIPEDKYDVIESMVDKLDEMEGKLNEQIERNVALNRRLAESVADVIFAEVAEGLALSQKDKLASLAENVEFDGEDNYREKLVTLRESYFPSNAGTQRDFGENLSEETDLNIHNVSGTMGTYLQTLQRVSKK